MLCNDLHHAKRRQAVRPKISDGAAGHRVTHYTRTRLHPTVIHRISTQRDESATSFNRSLRQLAPRPQHHFADWHRPQYLVPDSLRYCFPFWVGARLDVPMSSIISRGLPQSTTAVNRYFAKCFRIVAAYCTPAYNQAPLNPPETTPRSSLPLAAGSSQAGHRRSTFENGNQTRSG